MAGGARPAGSGPDSEDPVQAWASGWRKLSARACMCTDYTRGFITTFAFSTCKLKLIIN